MGNSRKTGAAYEQLAAQHLETLGYEMIEKNFRCRMGEIDLIAKDGPYLVFIEVKYRKDASMCNPLEAVDWKKQKRISKAASYYCLTHGISGQQPCRFDAAAYLQGAWTVIQNAFDYRE